MCNPTRNQAWKRKSRKRNKRQEPDQPIKSRKKYKQQELEVDETTGVIPTYTDPWTAKFKELCMWKYNHDNCSLSAVRETNPNLASWMMDQRRALKRFVNSGKMGCEDGYITQDRIDQLDSIGFSWGIYLQKHLPWHQKEEHEYQRIFADHGYHRQIYCQYLTPEHVKNHDLSLHASKKTKKSARAELWESHKVAESVRFDVSQEMFYCFKGFSKIPHGSSPATEQAKNDLYLKHFGNGGKGAKVTHVKLTERLNLTHKCVRVAYPGSPHLACFESCGLDKLEMLKFVLKCGSFVVDSRDSQIGIAKRVTTGFSQKQGKNTDNAHFAFNEQDKMVRLCHFPDTKKVDLMSPTLKEQVGKIMSMAQKLLNIMYGDQQPHPFEDSLRNKLYGQRFARIFSPNCTALFEFVDFFVETGSALNRHMDYENGADPGYDYGASYSYVITYQGKLYRVNMIMCTRKKVDSSKKELKQGGGVWKLV